VLADNPSLPGRGQPAADLPIDPALPGLEAIRTLGLAAALPDLGLTDGRVEIRTCNHVMGTRMTFETRAGDRRFAVKLYADDPAPEAELYQELARLGLARDLGPRVPRLLAWNRHLRLVVISWLEGPTAHHLIKLGHGARAGELAASWLWHASRKRVRLGPPRGREHMIYQAGVSAGALGSADRMLGAATKSVAKLLVRIPTREKAPRLVHGTLYARHIFDMDGSPGVIDWTQFGQGPVELDAGMFLATISRLALRHEPFAAQAARATEMFLTRVQRLVDPCALEWYWAAGLLHLAARRLKTRPHSPVPPETPAVVDEAARHAGLAARNGSPRSHVVLSA